jgi:hypothetical protein
MIDGRTTRQPGYAVSQRVRKRVEEIFGWMKTIGNSRKTRYIGLGANQIAVYLIAAAYNLCASRNSGPTLDSRKAPSFDEHGVVELHVHLARWLASECSRQPPRLERGTSSPRAPFYELVWRRVSKREVSEPRRLPGTAPAHRLTVHDRRADLPVRVGMRGAHDAATHVQERALDRDGRRRLPAAADVQ